MSAALALAVLVAAKPQEQPPSPVPQSVTFQFAAVDKLGQATTDLKPEELQLTVDKKEHKIDSLQFNASASLTMVLLFDVSGSRRFAARSQELKAFSDFLHRIWKPDDSLVAAAFNLNVASATGLLRDLDSIDQSLDALANFLPQGCTAVYDAFTAIRVEHLSPRPNRRLIFVMSDFEDNCSKNRVDVAIEDARRMGMAVHSFVLREGLEERRGKERGLKAARALSEQTGGEVLSPQSGKEFSLMLEQLSGRIRGFYSLSYTPSVSGSTKDRVSIDLRTTRRDVKLLFPKGRGPMPVPPGGVL